MRTHAQTLYCKQIKCSSTITPRMATSVLALLLAATYSSLSVEAAPIIVANKISASPLLSKQLVDEVNNRPYLDSHHQTQSSRWKAALDNGRLITGATRQQVKRLLGAKHDDGREWASHTRDVRIVDRVFSAKELSQPIPEQFNSAERWPNCTTILHIWDQSNCGSCWAVGAASAISDRICISGTRPRVEFLSARDLLTCCTACGDGCDGGYAVEAWAYWVKTGLVAETCQPYPFPKCGHTPDSEYPPCSSSTPYDTPDCLGVCNGDDATTRNKNKTLSFVSKGSTSYRVKEEEDYQREIMLRGPIEATFMVFADFVSYKSGVYQTNRKEYLGNHAVRIVGWGILDGVKYWKIANSWNSDWGDNGYILIRRGTNECGIERTGIAGVPV